MPIGPSGSSRSSRRAAGWQCTTPGSYKELVPAGTRRFSWLSPPTLLRSRNDKVARLLGDTTNADRVAWVAAQLEQGADPDFTIDRSGGDQTSFVVIGDTGEGDVSQYAVVPALLSAAGDTSFAVICSDVIYPAGDVGDYENNFFRPFMHYSAPIYAIPGNHDWYDGLGGFMFHFCGNEQRPPKVKVKGLVKRFLRKLLWRKPRDPDPEQIAAMRKLRAALEQQATQPGPYIAIDAGSVLLVGIDTGITGLVDSAQGEWLRRISAASDKPKILLTGKPIYVDARHAPGKIEGGGTVDEIVRDPANNYIAAIGGDLHNYQRYPVDVGGGRTIQYIVSGGGGAFMHATHKIARVALPGCDERDFRCYPLRGDSLAVYSRRYDKRLAFGRGWLELDPDEAAAVMAERLGGDPQRASARQTKPSRRARLKAKIVFPLPGRAVGPWQKFFSEFLDFDDPPLFKSFLRIDASAEALRIRCFAATGCGEHEADPPVEDELVCSRQADGSWSWAAAATSRVA